MLLVISFYDAKVFSESVHLVVSLSRNKTLTQLFIRYLKNGTSTFLTFNFLVTIKNNPAKFAAIKEVGK